MCYEEEYEYSGNCTVDTDSDNGCSGENREDVNTGKCDCTADDANSGKCDCLADEKAIRIQCKGCEIIHTIKSSRTLRLYSCDEANDYYIVRDYTKNTAVAGDGTIRFTASGTIRVWVRSSYTGEVVDCYRITAFLMPGQVTMFTVVHYCNCDDKADSGSGGTKKPTRVELCDEFGNGLEEQPQTMEIGDRVRFTYKIYNSIGRPAVKWSVYNPEFVTIDESGIVHARDAGVSKLRIELQGGESYSEIEIRVNVGEYLVTAEQMRALGWNEFKTSIASMEDINRTLKKFEITTTERIRHFLAQCFIEIGRSDAYNDYVQDGSSKIYCGAGAIQMTYKYHYMAFATYKILEKYPFLDGVHLAAAHHDMTEIEPNYYHILQDAANAGISVAALKKFTDIYDIGAKYVGKNYPWESAGYYWQMTDFNEIVDGFTPGRVNDVDVISKKIKSNSDLEARRQAYIRACEVIQ